MERKPVRDGMATGTRGTTWKRFRRGMVAAVVGGTMVLGLGMFARHNSVSTSAPPDQPVAARHLSMTGELAYGFVAEARGNTWS
jgi:hypothetical protein